MTGSLLSCGYSQGSWGPPRLSDGALAQENGVGAATTGRGQSGTMHACRSAAETERGPVIGLLLAWDGEGGSEEGGRL